MIVIISGLVGIIGWLTAGGLEPAHQLSLQAFRLQAQALQGGFQLGNLGIKGLGHEQCWGIRGILRCGSVPLNNESGYDSILH